MTIIEWPLFCENGFTGLIPEEKPLSITIGIFDGVHLGHQALIKRIVSHNDKIPVVITFRHEEKNTPEIQSFHERTITLEKLGVKILLVIDFTESFKRMSGIEFLELLNKHGNIGFFAVGSNFRCGYQLDTDAAAIQRFFSSFNIPAEIIPEVKHDSQPISSSRIRAAIAAGDFQLAEIMLGRS